jgi:hypothetical protein
VRERERICHAKLPDFAGAEEFIKFRAKDLIVSGTTARLSVPEEFLRLW